MDHLLYDGQFFPITEEIEFLKCDLQTLVDTFCTWQRGLDSVLKLTSRPTSGPLSMALAELWPLARIGATKYLFAATSSGWIACFGNNFGGNDQSFAHVMHRTLACAYIRACYIPDTIRGSGSTQTGNYGATIFAYYAPEASSIVSTRDVCAMNDGGRWTFDQSGEPFAFEDTSKFSARRVADKFTPEMLDSYLSNFGIRKNDPDFYCGPYVLIQLTLSYA